MTVTTAHYLAALKGWIIPLLMVVVFGMSMTAILWWPTPTVTNVTDVVLVAVCRDGTRILRREDGTHYARFGLNRIDVPNPETVCK